MKIITSLTFLALTFCAAFLDTAGAQPLTITTIAGQFNNEGYINNSVGTNALFHGPSGICADPAGNLYVIDAFAIRKISPSLMVNTIAGNETYGGYQDASTNALFLDPWDLAVDKNGYIYVADWGNNVVRKITPLGVVTTLAGNGTTGYLDAKGTNAEFGGLTGIAVDSSGNVYVSDGYFPPPYTSSFNLIRKITPDGVVSTLAGGAQGYNDGVGTGAQFFGPSGLAVDAGGTVYVADDFGIRKVSPDGTVTTWAGSQNNNGTELDGIGANAGFEYARGIALDRRGGAYVTDENGKTIRYVYSAGVVTTVAGLADQTPINNYNDGVGSDARFTSPYGIAVNSAGTVFITDEFGRTVLAGEPPSLSPISSVSESAGVAPIRSNNPWQFTAVFTNIVSDVRLRVQSTTTTNLEASWTDLPVNLAMTDVGGLWTLNTTNSSITNVPPGTQYFRVVASAPGYFDSDSAAVGPEIVLPPPELSVVGSFLLTTGGTPVRSSNPWQFIAGDTDLVPGLQLRVQSTTTTNVAGSWQDLPGVHYMTNNAGGWTLDKTDVPTGVQYFRVVASAPGYVDGMSSIVGPQTVLPGFGLWGYFSFATSVPYSTATLWGFAIGQPSQISGMSLRVQSSTTPDDVNSWINLPGGGQMTRQSDGMNWGMGTTNLPIGAAVSFRVVASAQDYVDLVSAALGPFDIGAPLPVATTTFSMGQTRTLQDIPGSVMNFFNAVGAIVHLIFAGNTTTQGAIALAAAPGSSIDLTINKGQVVKVAGLTVLSNATVLVSGTVNGPVNVGIPVVSNDGGSIVSHDGGSIVSHDGGSFAQDGGTAALAAGYAQNALIGSSGSTIIGLNGSGLIGSSGSTLNGQAGAGVSVESKTPLTPSPKIPAFTQPTFTGQMTVNGDYSQFPGTALIIGIAGTNTLSDGAQQFDQLVVNGQVNFVGGTIEFVLLDPDDQTNLANAFQPPDGATFDVVVASNILVGAVHIFGPIWGDGLFFSGSVVTRDDGLQAVRLMATHIPPQLFIQNTDSELLLVYGTNYTGYAVESSPDLVNWSTFSTGTNVVELNPTDANQFFRLSKP
jgi:hypothetical protein